MKLTEAKRKDIIDAAVEEFRVQGFVAARINRIAEAARVSKRTLYKHFESKEALFDAIIEIVMSDAPAAAPVDYEPGRPIDRQLIEALNAYVASITNETYMGLNRLTTSEFLRDQALARRAFSRAQMQNRPITGLIKSAMDAGALRPDDPDFAATQLLSLVKTFFFWPQFLLGEDMRFGRNPDQIMEDCVAMFMSHYAPASPE